MDCIDKRADDITLMDLSKEQVDHPKLRFEVIVKAYFKDLSLEDFIPETFIVKWFKEFEDKCYFNIDFIDREHICHAFHKLAPLVAAYWL